MYIERLGGQACLKVRAVQASGDLTEEDAHDLGKVLSLQQLMEQVSVIMQLNHTISGGGTATILTHFLTQPFMRGT